MLVVSGTSVYVAGIFDSPAAVFGTIAITFFNPYQNFSSFLGFPASLTDPILTATTAALPQESARFFPNPAHRTAILRLSVGMAPASLTDALGRAMRRYLAPAGAEAALDL